MEDIKSSNWKVVVKLPILDPGVTLLRKSDKTVLILSKTEVFFFSCIIYNREVKESQKL